MAWATLALEREHVLEVPLVALRPEVAVGGDLDELRRDPHALGVAPHRALGTHRTIDVQLTADLLQRLLGLLVTHRRRTRDDAQRLDLRERPR
jgi:hypothetical protein